ncbi:MAG: hypothetical protein AB7P04_07945 [Bacteriovoracia bacterium]
MKLRLSLLALCPLLLGAAAEPIPPKQLTVFAECKLTEFTKGLLSHEQRFEIWIDENKTYYSRNEKLEFTLQSGPPGDFQLRFPAKSSPHVVAEFYQWDNTEVGVRIVASQPLKVTTTSEPTTMYGFDKLKTPLHVALSLGEGESQTFNGYLNCRRIP